MSPAQKKTDEELAAEEKAVCKEFGKDFDSETARNRAEEIKAFWSRFDLNDKVCLDVGAGHPTVSAVLTTMSPTVRFDCVDLSPDFEREAGACIECLHGDVCRIRLVTADFYEIAELSAEGRLSPRYDFVLVIETLHHSLRKAHLLKVLTNVMDEGSRMVLVEPVLPLIGRQKAYDQSRWAREQGYIEEPVAMREYLDAFREAGLQVVHLDYEKSREFGLVSWRQKILPRSVYDFYRRRIRPKYALTSFTFICRLDERRRQSGLSK